VSDSSRLDSGISVFVASESALGGGVRVSVDIPSGVTRNLGIVNEAPGIPVKAGRVMLKGVGGGVGGGVTR